MGPAVFFTRADTGILTPEDLAGHSIIIKSAAWQALLEILLESGDLTLDDVELVEGSTDMTPFLEGDVDVWAGFLTDEVVRARLAGLELATFPLYEYGVRTNPITIYTSREHLDQQSDEAERFIRASLRGWQWAIDNRAEAIDIFLEMNSELPENREFYTAAFEAVIPLIIPPGSRLGAIDCSA